MAEKTRNRLGLLCMLLGLLLLFGAAALLLYNRAEDERAGEAAEELLEQLENMPVNTQQPDDPQDTEMTEVEIRGYRYIGYLEIPALDLKLPVMTDWSYKKLQFAPCRYSGSTKSDDLVIMAHNYYKFFGYLKNLIPGCTVMFTDMDGVVSSYEVVELENLTRTDVEEMTDGEYDLTLFTCTYGGRNRVTVRCNRVD